MSQKNYNLIVFFYTLIKVANERTLRVMKNLRNGMSNILVKLVDIKKSL